MQDVSDVTGFPEMLDGRVKTMHPKIAGGILAMRGKPEHMQALAEHGIRPIDMVVVNLYAFEEVAAKSDASLDELIENIDIGGPTMIRAAAKNYQDVAVVVSPADYAGDPRGDASRTAASCRAKPVAAGAEGLPHHGGLRSRHQRAPGAGGWRRPALPGRLDIRAPKLMDLRYGENPHQSAALYGGARQGIAGAEQLARQGAFLQQPGGSGCRLATGAGVRPRRPRPSSSTPIRAAAPSSDTLAEAYRKAFECDPVSAYGGVIGVQSRGGRRDRARDRQDLHRSDRRAGYSRPKRCAILRRRRTCG